MSNQPLDSPSDPDRQKNPLYAKWPNVTALTSSKMAQITNKLFFGVKNRMKSRPKTSHKYTSFTYRLPNK
jgi:hypothetical protein